MGNIKVVYNTAEERNVDIYNKCTNCRVLWTFDSESNRTNGYCCTLFLNYPDSFKNINDPVMVLQNAELENDICEEFSFTENNKVLYHIN